MSDHRLKQIDEIKSLAASLEGMFERMGITPGKTIAVVKMYLFNQLLGSKTKPEVYEELLEAELKTYKALYLLDRVKEGINE